MRALEADVFLVVRAGAARWCALPLGHVVETLRPLALEPLAGAPGHVLGIALIRGIAQPVVDLARLLGTCAGPADDITRLVTLRVGTRRVALAVAAVQGLRRIAPQAWQPLPPLLREAGQEAVAALATLDAELLLVLDSARLLPDETALEAAPP